MNKVVLSTWRVLCSENLPQKPGFSSLISPSLSPRHRRLLVLLPAEVGNTSKSGVGTFCLPECPLPFSHPLSNSKVANGEPQKISQKKWVVGELSYCVVSLGFTIHGRSWLLLRRFTIKFSLWDPLFPLISSIIEVVIALLLLALSFYTLFSGTT